MMTMEQLGILLYGYDKDHADIIENTLEEAFGSSLTVFAGAGKEERTLADILSEGPGGRHIGNEAKILVFLGFDNERIGAALGAFPRNAGLARPIFCGLTEQNINWPLGELVEHLLEEDRYFRGKADEQGGADSENGGDSA